LFAADSIAKRRNTEAIDTGSGRIISARIVEHQAARKKPFDEVRDEVRASLVRDESRQLAVQAGEARLKSLREGGDQAGFSATRSLTRSGQTTLPAPAMEAIFKAGTSKLPTFVGVDLAEQGYAIYQISKVIEPSAETVEKRAAEVRTQLEQLLSQQDVTDYVESVKQRLDISRSLSRLGASAQQ